MKDMIPLILLGVGSGLCWGTADFMGGLLSRRLPTFTVVIWSQLAGSLLIVSALVATAQHPVGSSIGWGAVSGIFGGIGLLCFYRGLAVGAMSVVAPVSACGAVIPVLVALLGGHVPTPIAGAGIAAAITGILLVSLRQDVALHPGGRPGLTLILALGAAGGFGLFFVFLHQGSQGPGASPLWAVAGARGSSVVVIAVLMAGRAAFAYTRPLARSGDRAARDTRKSPGGAIWPGRRLPLLALVGIMDTSANLLFAYASIQGNFGIAAVLGSMYPVATVLLGRIVLAERLGRLQNAGVGLALAGVALLSAGAS
jgi:drug/metabolite transporter (DMT)-like permease